MNTFRRLHEGCILKNSAQAARSNLRSRWAHRREFHYRRWFGDSADVHVWREPLPGSPWIDIYIFPPSPALDRHYSTVVTSGMSDAPMPIPEGADARFARAELLFYVDHDGAPLTWVEKPWYAQVLSFFAHFPFTHQTWLSISHTVPNGMPPAPVVNGSALTTAFFLPAVPEPPEFLDFTIGAHPVNFLWLTFITNDECAYKLEKGYEAFVAHLDQANFPQVFNPQRKSVLA